MKRFIILALMLGGLCLVPAIASAQVSIQTPGFGLSIGPYGGVGVRVGGVYGVAPPPVVVAPPPPVVVVPAAPFYPPPPPVIVAPPRPVRYYPPRYYPPRYYLP